MNILLEGPDGGGKTTLAEALGNGFYVHHGPPDNPWAEYLRTVTTAARCARYRSTIVDRLHPSELVYGMELRGADRLVNPARWRMLERVLLARPTALIICLPPKDVALSNWRARREEEMIQDEERMDTIWHRYRAFDRTYLPMMQYDYTKDGPGKVNDFVAGLPPGLPAPLVGTSMARVLLIGDQQRGVIFPFVNEHGCSPWLTEMLEKAKVGEDELAWANAFDHYGRELNPALMRALPFLQTTVALGRKAQAWCRRYHIRHRAVPHPQFWRRFHARETYPLITLLENDHGI